MLFKLKKESFVRVLDSSSSLDTGVVIIRENAHVTQLARFEAVHTDGALILSNVLDLNNNEFTAKNGLLRIQKEDSIYVLNSQWGNDTTSSKAAEIITQWALYTKHAELRKSILSFVKNTFPPKYILFLAKHDLLQYIFVPLQQYFSIGKFTITNKWENINVDKFKTILESLITNEYITYMGYLPQSLIAKPIFYSAGNETHLETDMQLKKEPFLYSSNCGGNIKLLKEESNKKYFLVDAGSSYKGNGVNSRIDEASIVSRHLSKIYPQYQFIPVEGRGAIGSRFCF